VPPGHLSPAEAASLLEAFGIPVVPWRLARDPRGAVEAAEGLGYPVVAKAVGPVHRTEVGGVRVGLRGPQEVAAAARDLLALGEAVLVQPQTNGVEVAVGGFRDPEAGPVTMVGLGGVAVEALGDVAFRRAPLPAEEARRAIASLRSFPLLAGVRGSPGADLDALAAVVAAASHLVASVPEVAELDLNPVFASPAGAVVADARVLVRAEATPGSLAPDSLRAATWT
jgi:acyl-CoA synthetase (NDP forming)